MFFFPTFVGVEISPIYQFLVLLYAGISLIVLVINIVLGSLTGLVNLSIKKKLPKVKTVKKERIKLKQTHFLSWIPLTLIAIISLAFTSYVLLNAVEEVFFVDLPYIETLREYNHSSSLNTVVSKTNVSAEFVHKVAKDIPRYITFPTISSTLELSPTLSRNDKYYVRGNKAHYIKRDKSNMIVVYLDQNWRTTTDLNNLRREDLLYLLSYDYNYVFKIDDVWINNPDGFVIPKNDILIPHLVIVGEEGNSTTIISATLINSNHR